MSVAAQRHDRLGLCIPFAHSGHPLKEKMMKGLE